MGGVVGRLFKEFSVTLSVAVAVSAVVSLTLTPMMCGRLLKPVSRLAPPITHGTFFRRRYSNATGAAWSSACDTRGSCSGIAVLTLVGTDRAIRGGAEGLSTAAGYRRHRGHHRGGAECISVPALSALQLRAAAIVEHGTQRSKVSPRWWARATVNPTPNVGRLAIVLKPRRQRAKRYSLVIARLQSDTRGPARTLGIDAAGAGHSDRRTRQPHAVSVYA